MKLASVVFFVGVLAGGTGCWAQTQVGLRTQAKDVDFSNAGATKPFRMGAALPASCVDGEAFHLTSASSGQNVHICAGQQWRLVGSAAGNFSQAFTNATTVTLAHQGQTSNVVPVCVNANEEAVEWDSFRVVDANTVVVTFSHAQSGRCVVNTAGSTGGSGSGASLPSQAGNGGKVLTTDGTAASWQAVTRLQDRAVAVTAPSNGQALVWNATSSQWEPGSVASGDPTMGGDVSGTASAATVEKLQGRAVASSAAANGQALAWNSTNARWEPGSPAAGGDLSGTAVTAVVERLQGRPVANSAPANGQALIWNSTASRWEPGSTSSSNPPVGGDLSGMALTATVERVQGRTVATTAPSDGQALIWNAANSRWEPGGVSVSLTSGVGILKTGNEISVDPASVPSFLTAAMTLDFPAIVGGGVAQMSFPLAGAMTGDAIACGWPNTLESGLVGIMYVSAADTVMVRIHNSTASSIDPGNQTFRATILRSF